MRSDLDEAFSYVILVAELLEFASASSELSWAHKPDPKGDTIAEKLAQFVCGHQRAILKGFFACETCDATDSKEMLRDSLFMLAKTVGRFMQDALSEQFLAATMAPILKMHIPIASIHESVLQATADLQCIELNIISIAPWNPTCHSTQPLAQPPNPTNPPARPSTRSDHPPNHSLTIGPRTHPPTHPCSPNEV